MSQTSKVGFGVVFVFALLVLVVAFAFGWLQGVQTWLRATLFAAPEATLKAVTTSEANGGLFALGFLLIGGIISFWTILHPKASGRAFWAKVLAWVFVAFAFLLAGSAGMIGRLAMGSGLGHALMTTITMIYWFCGMLLGATLLLRFSATD